MCGQLLEVLQGNDAGCGETRLEGRGSWDDRRLGLRGREGGREGERGRGGERGREEERGEREGEMRGREGEREGGREGERLAQILYMYCMYICTEKVRRHTHLLAVLGCT